MKENVLNKFTWFAKYGTWTKAHIQRQTMLLATVKFFVVYKCLYENWLFDYGLFFPSSFQHTEKHVYCYRFRARECSVHVYEAIILLASTECEEVELRTMTYRPKKEKQIIKRYCHESVNVESVLSFSSSSFALQQQHRCTDCQKRERRGRRRRRRRKNTLFPWMKQMERQNSKEK